MQSGELLEGVMNIIDDEIYKAQTNYLVFREILLSDTRKKIINYLAERTQDADKTNMDGEGI